MSQKFPLDEFDSAVSHGGRHRVRRTRRIRVLEFLRILVVGLVVAVVGYFGLKFVDATNLFTAPSAPVETISATDIAKGLEITILDATGTAGVADKVATALVGSGFNVTSAGDLGGDSSSNSKVDQTIVYYFDSGNKAAATVIAKALGAYPVKQSTAYAGAVTIVIGADYK
ncbi:MAG: LytR C-terminal domain-containing protein [Rhodoluna sp.]